MSFTEGSQRYIRETPSVRLDYVLDALQSPAVQHLCERLQASHTSCYTASQLHAVSSIQPDVSGSTPVSAVTTNAPYTSSSLSSGNDHSSEVKTPTNPYAASVDVEVVASSEIVMSVSAESSHAKQSGVKASVENCTSTMVSQEEYPAKTQGAPVMVVPQQQSRRYCEAWVVGHNNTCFEIVSKSLRLCVYPSCRQFIRRIAID